MKHCEAAIEHDLATRAIERRWAGEPLATGANPAAQRIDVLVDRTLGAIRDHVVAQTQGAAPDDPIHEEVAAFLKPIFPVSVQAITSLPYLDELAAVDDIVALLKGELALAVKEFGLGRLVTRLAPILQQDEAIGHYLRARRAIADVNPETGEDEPAPTPAAPPSPAAAPGAPEQPPIA
ncbi:hypothetical protein WMF27_04705 [Sorangium sp. So ce281]|uniref:hypothetical protein n=1 Tax=unclassified Sorangium TaxID=2621164 RepID=UPI003F602302